MDPDVEVMSADTSPPETSLKAPSSYVTRLLHPQRIVAAKGRHDSSNFLADTGQVSSRAMRSRHGTMKPVRRRSAPRSTVERVVVTSSRVSARTGGPAFFRGKAAPIPEDRIDAAPGCEDSSGTSRRKPPRDGVAAALQQRPRAPSPPVPALTSPWSSRCAGSTPRSSSSTDEGPLDQFCSRGLAGSTRAATELPGARGHH